MAHIIIGDDGNNDLAGSGSDDNRISGGGGNDRIRGGAGDDELSGGGGDDTISGGQGNDIIYGGDGDDVINGGADFDRAVYRGDISDYSFFIDDNGRLFVTDSVSGRDGTDTVKNVEEFNFNGTMFSYAEVAAMAGDGGALLT